MCVTYMPGAQARKSEDGIGFPGAEVVVSKCVGKPNLGPLQALQVPLTTEPSLQGHSPFEKEPEHISLEEPISGSPGQPSVSTTNLEF